MLLAFFLLPSCEMIFRVSNVRGKNCLIRLFLNQKQRQERIFENEGISQAKAILFPCVIVHVPACFDKRRDEEKNIRFQSLVAEWIFRKFNDLRQLGRRGRNSLQMHWECHRIFAGRFVVLCRDRKYLLKGVFEFFEIFVQ